MPGASKTSNGPDEERTLCIDGLENSQVLNMAVAALIGALLGVIISFTVNCTLVEISVNAFFAVYFGVLFVIISSWMLYRVYSGEHPRPILLGTFSAMVMFSGILCFVLESNWVVNMSRGAKVPLYSILGIAVTFALLFSIIDLVNYCYGSFGATPGKALVETEEQLKPKSRLSSDIMSEKNINVLLIVATATVLGFLFGLVFGLLDVEDQPYNKLREALVQQEHICYPIGAIVSAVASAFNQYLREKNSQEYHYESVRKDDVLDDEDF